MPDYTSTKTLKTRLQLKYDTYANWTDDQNQFNLLAGEVAIATIPGTGYHKDSQGNLIANKPAVLIKVGDGSHTYNELDFVQSKAADVYDWAKAEKLNITADSDVTAATKTWIENVVSGAIQDTDTMYTIEAVSGATYKYELKYKSKTDANYSSFSTPVYIDLSDVATRLSAVEDILDGFGGTSEPTTVASEISRLDTAINNIDVSSQISTALGALDMAATDVTAGSNITSGTPTVITGITQTDGQVAATKQTLNLGTAAWANVNTNAIADTDDAAGSEDTSLTTAAQVATYVKAKTAALTNAMHFKGALTPAQDASDADTLATVSNPAAGDIYLIGTKEYVFDGTNWALLGDEGTYAVRATVETALAGKVDKVDGKGLSTEDYTTTEKTKLSGIEDGAEVNVIEGVTVGGTAVTLTNKVAALGAMAGKANVAEADLDSTLATKINSKVDTVSATIASVSSDVVTLKAGLTKSSTTVANSSDSDIVLAKIAKTGNIDDLVQSANTYIVFDCGNASGWPTQG